MGGEKSVRKISLGFISTRNKKPSQWWCFVPSAGQTVYSKSSFYILCLRVMSNQFQKILANKFVFYY